MAKKRFLGGLILSLALAAPLHAAPPTTVVIGTPPQPGWSLLSTEQKILLSPLAKEWEEMDNIRRKKWLGIVERFPKMSPEEQLRVQQRMREWVSLTPEQRTQVRDSYKEFNLLPVEKKQVMKQKWETYSNLSEEEKLRVKQGGKLAPAPLSETGTQPGVTDQGKTQ